MKKITKSFDEIVNTKLKYGWYEKTVVVTLSFIFIADGIEISALSLILPLLREEWQISESLQGFMGSMLFLGLFLGSLFAGALTDKLGRKTCLLYISLLQFIFGVSSAFINNVYLFIGIRALFGFLLGFQVPLVPTLCAELVPIEFRGQITVIVNSLFSVGQFIATIIAYFCLSSLGSGNWRLLLFFCSFPSLVVWYLSYKYLMESPRFVILKMEIEQGIEILNKMIFLNTNKNEKSMLFSLQKEGMMLKRWAENFHLNHKKNNEKFQFFNFITSLFEQKYCKITIGMWISWFGINFLFYGLVFILPFFLNQWDHINERRNTQENGLFFLLITTAGEGASGILAYFLVETPTFGRKYSLILGQLVSSVGCLVSFMISIDYGLFLVVLLTISRFFGKMCFAVIYPLTAEIYPTSLRTNAIGVASAVGRMASCIMPIITIRVFYFNIYAPFMLFCVVGLFGLLGTFLLHETRGVHLDLEARVSGCYYNEDEEEDDLDIVSPIQI